MKKLYPILLLFVLLFNNQKSIAQIPNGGFENLNSDGSIRNWGNVYLFAVIIDSLGNQLVDSIVFDGPLYAKTMDSYSGNYAMEMRNAFNFTANQGIPGSVSADTDSVYSAWGSLEFLPLNQQPLAFAFYYKYLPVAGDSGIANLRIYNAQADEIGHAQVILSGLTSTYTYSSSLITFTTLDVPAFFSLNFSTKFSLADNPTNANLGTYLIIDDVTLSTTTAVPLAETTDNNFSLFPNPSQDNIHVNSKQIENTSYRIYDMFGKIIYHGTIFSGTQLISTLTLANGVYAIEFESKTNSKRINFVVAH
ncbi:MAG: T9SS type A sorting domain-containing protein [Bacteroidetes bacterium]|nr:T9SS type A sorting domain-containing protein [Bacteroidota bacterium]